MKKGFTLVELLIVIGILMMLAISAYAPTYFFRDQLRFKAAYNEVTGMIQTARNYALSGQSYVDFADYDNDGDFSDQILAHGYIVNIAQPAGSPAVIKLYADLYGSTLGQIDSKDELLDETELNEEIAFTVMVVDQNGDENTLVDKEDFSFLYTTPSADFSLVDFPRNGVQIMFSQLDNEGVSMRDKYLYVHYLYGIPELLDEPYL